MKVNVSPPHYVWPVITSETVSAVMRQLGESISIYDRSGTIDRLERRLEATTGLRHAVLFNSGTSAIHAMYAASGISKGDEVICSGYTFFASSSPLFSLGAIPVLADCTADGNIDPAEIERLISPKTKAVSITHLWGIPCDMDEIVDACRKHGLPLLEDISHAFGATYRGQMVGTFGAASALSMQAQKTLVAGEGGVVFTNSDEIYHRSLLFGHYNKRCLGEIPKDHGLYSYGITGFGLKCRIHPLAAAIAEQQLDQVPQILAGRDRCAAYLQREISRIPGLQTMIVPPHKRPSWYALVFSLKPDLADLAEEIHAAFRAHGCLEVDRPNSTRPLCDLALYRDPAKIFAEYADRPIPAFRLPVAQRVYRSSFKMPVWHEASDEHLYTQYVDAIADVMKSYYSRR